MARQKDDASLFARYDYDHYGRLIVVEGNINSEGALFGYTGHLWHQRSGMWLAQLRAGAGDTLPPFVTQLTQEA